MRENKAIRFVGGRGPRYVRRTSTPSGRAVPAPRIAPAAATAARTALQELATKGATTMAKVLMQSFQSDTRWNALVSAIRRVATAAQAEGALAVVRDQRGRFIFADESSHPMIIKNFLRVLRRRGAEAPQLKSIGVKCAPIAGAPKTFGEWIDEVPSGKLRPTPPASSQQGPRAYVRQWRIDETEAHGVVCFGRAGDRVRAWRRKEGASEDTPPPPDLVASLVHVDTLPTATASRPDQYWLTQYGRYMSVREVTRSFGIEDCSPLSEALQLVPCPTNAVLMLGKAIHATVALEILRHIDLLGLLPEHVNYASACSGVDTFASTMDTLRPGAWSYLHAAEKEKAPREVLKRAWGLSDDAIYHDAASPHAAQAERTHIYMISPECNAFSRRRHGRDATTMAHGAAGAAAVMPYLMAARADIVVVENVDEPDAVAAITTILHGATAYGWRSQRLDPTDFGLPVSRSRRYFVGVLREIAPWWA